MDAATDSKVEVKGTMRVTDEHWNAIFGTKEVSVAEKTEEVDDNNGNQ